MLQCRNCIEFMHDTHRLGFLEKASCLQFSVCASLSDLDHLRKVESEPAKVLVLDSNHNLWYWEPVKKGSVPNHIPGLARHKGDITPPSLMHTCLIYIDICWDTVTVCVLYSRFILWSLYFVNFKTRLILLDLLCYYYIMSFAIHEIEFCKKDFLAKFIPHENVPLYSMPVDLCL